MQYFKTVFLEEAQKFLAGLPRKTSQKVFYNIRWAQEKKDPELFKKLQHDIWEFRTNYGGQQIRLLAFWDKQEDGATLVVATHGFIKKFDKVRLHDIVKAVSLKDQYFYNK